MIKIVFFTIPKISPETPSAGPAILKAYLKKYNIESLYYDWNRDFFDVCEDLGINLGNKFDSEVITIKKEWGSHYEPTEEDIKSKIKELEAQLQLLKK